MRSQAVTIEEYIAEAPLERRGALNLLLGLCREELSGFDEAMRHGMPCFMRDGAVEVAFASQKAYVSLYILRQVALEANAERLAGLSVGKGCIRFRRPEQIDPLTVRALLSATATASGPICYHRDRTRHRSSSETERFARRSREVLTYRLRC